MKMTRLFLALLLASGCVCHRYNVVLCGNGEVDRDEACDDGNLDDTDGCTSTCVVA
ncbi:MAG: hypothetical protein RL199_1573, partial [Pseudomonadota bacterium]